MAAGASAAAAPLLPAGPNGLGNGHGAETSPLVAAPLVTATTYELPGVPGALPVPAPAGGRVASSDGGEAFTYYDVDEDPPPADGFGLLTSHPAPPTSPLPPVDVPAPSPLAVEPAAPPVRSIFDRPLPAGGDHEQAAPPVVATPPPTPAPVPAAATPTLTPAGGTRAGRSGRGTRSAAHGRRAGPSLAEAADP